ncbi:MAG: PEP-utilizing enzyme [Candidatus Moranbacteria bacterium]|nr:PEP-utilizing enzyme [Candidatus Moranbacteria bacterium]
MNLRQVLDRKGMYIYPWYISDIAVTKDIASIAPTNVKKVFVSIKDNLLTMYYDTDAVDKIAIYFLDKILVNDIFFDEVIKNIYHCADDLLSFCRESAEKKVEKMSDEELLSIYRTYTEKLRTLRIWGWVPPILDGMTDPFLSQHLLTRFGEFMVTKGLSDKVSEYYSTLSSSERESEVQGEEIARLTLAQSIVDSSQSEEIIQCIKNTDEGALQEKFTSFYALLEKHTQAFGALTYSYSGPAMTIAYLLKALADDFERGDIRGQRKKIQDHFRNIKEEKRKIIEAVDLSADLQREFRVSAELMYIKDWRKGAYQKSYLLMDVILQELAKRLDISLKEIKFLVFDEVREALTGGKGTYYKALLEERLKHCCYSVENGIIVVSQGKACEVLEEKIKKESVSMEPTKMPIGDIREIKGSVAYSGYAKGIVKIVLTVEDTDKVNEGDILVSSATNPDLMLAMRKAAAFVTDTGGIMSHASIVSREMKKPCVVGTKIATHIFKDGDLVEVDAKNGVVRILKKK